MIKPFLQNDHFSPGWARWRITKYELGTRHQGSHRHWNHVFIQIIQINMCFSFWCLVSIQSQYDLEDWNALERTSPQQGSGTQSKDHANHRILNIIATIHAARANPWHDWNDQFSYIHCVRRRSGVECSALGFFRNTQFYLGWFDQ